MSHLFSQDELSTFLEQAYGIESARLTPLAIGADADSFLFRVDDGRSKSYFLKLRTGEFNGASVLVKETFKQTGIFNLTETIPTQEGTLWGDFVGAKTLLSLFVAGKNGYETQLSETHWAEFGSTLGKIHSVEAPADLELRLRKETFDDGGRQAVLDFLAQASAMSYPDEIGAELASFLQLKRAEIETLVGRARKLAANLKGQNFELAICHSDLHAGNLLISNGDQNLYLVDWDEVILAPKERDLMYIGGSLLASGLPWEVEERLFYQAYGDVELNMAAICYYRYERIIQDIFAYCKELLLSPDGSHEERQQSFAYLRSNFTHQNTIDAANRSWGKIC